MLLTQKQIELFEEDGYLILEDFVSPEACESLRDRAAKLWKTSILLNQFPFLPLMSKLGIRTNIFWNQVIKSAVFLRKNPLAKMENCFRRRNFPSIKSVTPCMIWIRFLKNSPEHLS